MEIAGDGLDDVLIELYKRLLADGMKNTGSRGVTVELLGVTLRIRRPRARLSRSEDRGKPFSAIGELLWYLSGSEQLEFVEPYIPQYANDAVDGILQGAYGPRLFQKNGSINQIENAISLLTCKPGSRRAVIQIFDAEDIATKKREIPCTNTIQLHLRNKTLHMSVTMRSNDAYWGLPHDVFCFTMLHEMFSCRLCACLGEYIHHVGSMHIYDTHIPAAQDYISEGYQRPIEMPIMAPGNPFVRISTLLSAEARIRSGDDFHAEEVIKDPYWSDIIRLLQVHWASRRRMELSKFKLELMNQVYLPFVYPRLISLTSNAQSDSQRSPE